MPLIPFLYLSFPVCTYFPFLETQHTPRSLYISNSPSFPRFDAAGRPGIRRHIGPC